MGQRQNAQLAALVQGLQRLGQHHHAHRHMSGNQILQRRTSALVGHMRDVRVAGLHAKHFTRQMRHRAGAGRGPGIFARVVTHQADQLLQIPGRNRMTDCNREGGQADQGDRCEIACRIKACRTGGGQRIDHMRAGGANQQCVAIGLRSCHFQRTDRATGATLVVDHDGLRKIGRGALRP